MKDAIPIGIVTEHVQAALAEDLGECGDITSDWILDPWAQHRALIFAKKEGVIAGLDFAIEAFRLIDENIATKPVVRDGVFVAQGSEILRIGGPAVKILSAERTALNFLQHLSGIATETSKFVKRVGGKHAKILDTRKTTPGLRAAEKYAVRMGGGHNHRFGLFDMVLVKENHIRAAGGLSNAVTRVRENLSSRESTIQIEVEAATLALVQVALELRVDRIMLDNMGVTELRRAVELVDGRIALEASGGITLETVGEIAATGVDYISVGGITHSAPALDLSLLIQED